jgi:hypothetical protein
MLAEERRGESAGWEGFLSFIDIAARTDAYDRQMAFAVMNTLLGCAVIVAVLNSFAAQSRAVLMPPCGLGCTSTIVASNDVMSAVERE